MSDDLELDPTDEEFTYSEDATSTAPVTDPEAIAAQAKLDSTLPDRTCEDCGFVSQSAQGLAMHRTKKHAPTLEAEIDRVLGVERGTFFKCERFPSLIIAPKGVELARFVDGLLESTDQRVIDICDSIPEVARF